MTENITDRGNARLLFSEQPKWLMFSDCWKCVLGAIAVLAAPIVLFQFLSAAGSVMMALVADGVGSEVRNAIHVIVGSAPQQVAGFELRSVGSVVAILAGVAAAGHFVYSFFVLAAEFPSRPMWLNLRWSMIVAFAIALPALVADGLEARERLALHDRVELAGAILASPDPVQVRGVSTADFLLVGTFTLSSGARVPAQVALPWKTAEEAIRVLNPAKATQLFGPAPKK